ncbi:MAG: hypothetical protein V4724_05370 [Pseudomonadota bacterium]
MNRNPTLQTSNIELVAVSSLSAARLPTCDVVTNKIEARVLMFNNGSPPLLDRWCKKSKLHRKITQAKKIQPSKGWIIF